MNIDTAIDMTMPNDLLAGVREEVAAKGCVAKYSCNYR